MRTRTLARSPSHPHRPHSILHSAKLPCPSDAQATAATSFTAEEDIEHIWMTKRAVAAGAPQRGPGFARRQHRGTPAVWVAVAAAVQRAPCSARGAAGQRGAGGGERARKGDEWGERRGGAGDSRCRPDLVR